MKMTLEWSVIKYVPDLWRNEPRNVGVVVRDASSFEIRFFAESEEEAGKVDGRVARRLKLDTESYKEWVHYFRRMLAAGRWDDVVAAQRRRPDFPYIVASGGTLAPDDSADLTVAVQDLYRELVAVGPEGADDGDNGESSGETSRARILRIFNTARVPVIEGVSVPAIFRGRSAEQEVRQMLRFPYGYKNGRQHLFDSVTGRAAAYSFYARAEAAHNADASVNLTALYSSARLNEHGAEMSVIETYGNAVNIDNEGAASEQIADIVRASLQG